MWIGHWFRDTENKNKRISQSQGIGGKGTVSAGVRIVENKDADTQTSQWVGGMFNGDFSEGDGAITTWTRVKTAN